MATAICIKKVREHVPENLCEASACIGRIGRCQRQLDEIELEGKEVMARFQERVREKVEALREERKRALDALYGFANSRRRELISEAGKKTVELPDGNFGWRVTPPSVDCDDDGAAIELLKDLGLPEFVRVKEELDREALLAARDGLDPIDGISFTQREEFVVVPKDHAREVKKTRTIRLG